jgi:hypothetical protein
MADKNSWETVIKWIVVAILAVVALKVVASILAVAFFAGGLLLTRVLPIVLLVWVVLKLVEWFRGKNGGRATAESDL